MKVVILAGGKGTRFAEETVVRPKPMIEIGGSPILLHIMKHFEHSGLKDFVIALGYKGEVIKRFFLDSEILQSGLSIDLNSDRVRYHPAEVPDWHVDLVETGLETQTGGRIKALAPIVGNETFLLSWGDGVSDVDTRALTRFHRAHGKLATMVVVHPPARFGHVTIDGDRITTFEEKPQRREGWINGGVFVLEPQVFRYIQDAQTQFEKGPLSDLASDGQLMAFRHEGFWQCMDTIHDRRVLEDLWTGGRAPWATWEKEGNQALVTGHLGYVGVVLAPLLRDAGWDVTGLDIGLYERCDYAMTPDVIPTITKDIRDVTAKDLAGFDAVFHLAGLSNDPLGDVDPSLTEEINFAATVSLGKAARDAGVSRFIFSSSCSNYGASDGGWLDENSPLKPVTPYAQSKVQSEVSLGELATESFSPVFLRSGTAYGYSPRIRFDLVVNNLTAWAVATGEVRLKSDGSAWRPLVHVEDMARAFILVANADRQAVHNQAFNVGVNQDCMQVRQIAEAVEKSVPGSRVTFAKGGDADVRTYKVDCSKIANLGFRPKWSVEKGIAQLCDVFMDNRIDVEAFEGSQFQRVAHVLQLMNQGAFDTRLRQKTPCLV